MMGYANRAQRILQIHGRARRHPPSKEHCFKLLARAAVRRHDSCESAPLAPLGERGPGVRGADSTPRGVSLLLHLLISRLPQMATAGAWHRRPSRLASASRAARVAFGLGGIDHVNPFSKYDHQPCWLSRTDADGVLSGFPRRPRVGNLHFGRRCRWKCH